MCCAFIDCTESFTVGSNLNSVLCCKLLCLLYHLFWLCWQCLSLRLSNTAFVAWIRLHFAACMVLNDSACLPNALIVHFWRKHQLAAIL